MSKDKDDTVNWEALKCSFVSKRLEKTAKFVCCVCGHHPNTPEEYTRLTFQYNNNKATYQRAVCSVCKNVLKE